MSERTYDRVAGLPLTVDDYELVPHRRPVSPGFERVTTVVRLHGDGETGEGEDVTYEPLDHELFRAATERLPLTGRSELGEFSKRLDDCVLFERDPAQYASRQYRRWAFESAALDLALRQAEQPLHAILGRSPSPVRFLVSLRIGEPASIEPVDRLLARNHRLRFKLDPTSDWSDRLCQALSALGRVEVLDLKGAYRGTPVDQAPDAGLYRRLVKAFDRVWLEDPHLDRRTLPVLEDHLHRVTWDAPIHSVADIAALPFRPRMLNMKPSRFGTLRELCNAYDYCARRDIRMYGGGQFELGPGRGQIQYLASLFHPNAPNDVAPPGYNEPELPPDLPPSPLPPAPGDTGFRWGDRES
jgi:L-alanine-DL-glutamate epimerase-like enolase superfamily enzyme